MPSLLRLLGSPDRLRLESVDRNAAFMCVLPQHQLDATTDLHVVTLADGLQHQPGAVIHVEHRDRQRSNEGCRHRVVDDERVHCAAASELHRLELRTAAVDAMRMDRRWRTDGAAVDAPTTDEAEHLVRTAHEHRALRWNPHRDGLA